MENEFQFLTYSGFYIHTSQNYRILVDPFLDDNTGTHFRSTDFFNIDLILVTHGAYDHVGDTGKIAKRCGSWVVCPDDVKALLQSQGVSEKQILALPWGMAVNFGAVQVRPIENHHRTVLQLPDGGYVASQPLAFILYLEDGTRVYIAGDTALFSDMKLQAELYDPHIGLVNAVTEMAEREPERGRPCVTTGEMSPYEAALCSKWMKLKAVIPCHHITPEKNPQIREYVEHMARICSDTQVIVLRDGERFCFSCAKETKGEIS